MTDETTGSGNQISDYVRSFIESKIPPRRPFKVNRSLPKIPTASSKPTESDDNDYEEVEDNRQTYTPLAEGATSDREARNKPYEIPKHNTHLEEDEPKSLVRFTKSIKEPPHIISQLTLRGRRQAGESEYIKFMDVNKTSSQEDSDYEYPEEETKSPAADCSSDLKKPLDDLRLYDNDKYEHCLWLKQQTVKDVGKHLKSLALTKFVKHFSKERIDGNILCDLNEEILQADFKFSRTDVIKLMKFIKTGHVPKTT